MKYRRVAAVLVLAFIMMFIAGRSSGSGREALQAENNSYFTQEIYDNLKEMRFYFGGGEQADVVTDEGQMYEIFNLLSGLSESDTGEEELLYGVDIFEFEIKNGDVHRYTEVGRNMTHCLNFIPETMDNYKEVVPINKKNTDFFYVDRDIALELNALVRGTGNRRKALQAENNSYFTQEIYDNLKEMRFYFGGGEQADVVTDEGQMYEIFNFLAGLTQCDTGNEELLWGVNEFEFEMKNGAVHTYTQSGKNISHCLTYVSEITESEKETASINEGRTELFYVDHGITEELDALVRGIRK